MRTAYATLLKRSNQTPFPRARGSSMDDQIASTSEYLTNQIDSIHLLPHFKEIIGTTPTIITSLPIRGPRLA